MLLALFLSYLIGSIPFGLLLTHAAGLGDIRKIGSGNIGATNVLRTGNKKLAALTLLLDGGKGAVAVLIVAHFAPNLAPIAALGALLGHLFPVWLKFKGGKGVATGIGVMTALYWPIGVTMMLIWLATAKIFRFSSLAALVAFGATPVALLLLDRNDLLILSLAIAALIIFKHRANIKRLLNHTEPKIGESKNVAP